MAKQTKDVVQSQVALPQDGASTAIPPRQEGETMLEYSARVRTEQKRLKAEALANRPEKAASGTPSKPRHQVDEQAVNDAWYEFQGTNSTMSVAELAEALHKAGLWSEKEATTIFMLSGYEQEPASQKEVAEVLNCNTWMVFNYRRDALTKLADVIGDDWEAYHEPLHIRRGAAKPERHSQYWAPVTEEEKSRRKTEHEAEVAQRKADRAAAKSQVKQA